MKMFVGNWKMNKTKQEALKYLEEFKPEAEVVIAAPYTLLSVLHGKIKLAAQNLHYEDKGAFTGEISASMIKDFAEYVIVGHSERRKYFNETNEIINKKIKAALRNGLKVIFCLGETAEQRNDYKAVIENQLRKGLTDINIKDNVIIAYEPVWAIGTGKNAIPEQAEEVHKFLRDLLSQLYSQEVANNTKILYGGSVTSQNSGEFLKMPNINGLLVGGASLDASEFAKIIKS